MRLTVVGCSGSFPGPESSASCYLVEHEGFRLVLDLGHGSLGSLQRFAGLDTIGAVFLSHLHADHFIDLTAYYVVRRHWHGGPLPTLPVYGPASTRERLVAAYGSGVESGLEETFAFHPTAPGRLAVGPFDLTMARTAHPVECYAVRVAAAGRSMTFTGDTGESAAVTDLAAGTDLLLAEATFLETETNPEGLHMTGRQAARMANVAGARLLVLTHVPPWHDPVQVRAEAEAERADQLRVELARPGAAYDV